jgi:hypothetical protein
MATVDRVVPAGAGAWPMAAMLENEPAPQRHAQLQDPSVLRVPDPAATAPGEPTETAGAAEDWCQRSFLRLEFRNLT